MRLVGQISPYTCPLACLESFLFDIGQRITQEEIIRLHPDICIPKDSGKRHEIGALPTREFDELCRRLLIHCQTGKDHRQEVLEPLFSGLQPHATVVLLINYPTGRHMVRLAAIEKPGSWIVMNPEFLRPHFSPLLFTDLTSWDFEFCILTRS